MTLIRLAFLSCTNIETPKNKGINILILIPNDLTYTSFHNSQ